MRSDRRSVSRARMKFLFPWIVLISPLWATIRYGWARGHMGKVLVENREWTRARALSIRSSCSSGKKVATCEAVSIPL